MSAEAALQAARQTAHAELFAAKLDEMRPRFAATLSGRLNEMEEMRDSHVLYSNPVDAIELFRHNAHKTAGMAATMGYPDLGMLCTAVEVAIDTLLSSPAQMDELFDHMLNAVDDMLGEMALIVQG
ncbi:Hpt domain-containing protein [Thalassovita sp.]|jgi:chemotaxis protein histidine kinase CheA|uniref:Hpt domain-containing protein n=1 Tax=Thalassovita sp. TaxID=1979401 RepID=UPI003B59180F